MSVNSHVISKIKALYLHADIGSNTYYLEHANQQDVMDTVNYLHAKFPDRFLQSNVDYSGRADITFMKK